MNIYRKNEIPEELRQYFEPVEIGLEQTPDEYVEKLVRVFAEVRRVLRQDGVLFLNLGDSYASGKGSCFNPGGGDASLSSHAELKEAGAYKLHRGNKSDLKKQGLKPKDLIGIPWLVAFALRADGFYLRQDIIWAKGISGEACKYGWSGGVMPESVEDRFTKAHEHVFFFTKSPRYFFDNEAVKEDAVGVSAGNKAKSYGVNETPVRSEGEGEVEILRGIPWKGSEKRNRRDVWTIQRKNFRGAHFAVFPPELVRLPIQAGTSERGCCPKCGSPWTRIVEKGLTAHDGKTQCAYAEGMTANRLALLRQAARERGEEYSNQTKTIGWKPTCDCGISETVPCVVLDCFAGSGTTGQVAKEENRNSILIELNLSYIPFIQERVGEGLEIVGDGVVSQEQPKPVVKTSPVRRLCLIHMPTCKPIEVKEEGDRIRVEWDCDPECAIRKSHEVANTHKGE